MKQILIACSITTAVCITFNTVFGIIMQTPIPNHSQKFKDLEMIDERVRQNEIIAFNRLDSLTKIYFAAQRRIDSLGAVINASNTKFSSYEKQLKEIRAGLKSTNFQDSSKTAIINGLPK